MVSTWSKIGAAVGVAGAQAAVVEVGRAPVVHQRHHVGAGFAERLVEIRVGLVQPDDETDRLLRPFHDLIGVAAQRVAIVDAAAPC